MADGPYLMIFMIQFGYKLIVGIIYKSTFFAFSQQFSKGCKK